METSRNLTRKQAEKIIKATFPNYRGRKIQLQLTENSGASPVIQGGVKP
jgi:hypothetical protein